MDTTAHPQFRHLISLEARLAASLDSGLGPLGRRVLNIASEGRFFGDRLNGSINPGTGDWMLTREKIRIVDARLVLMTDDGAVIHMTYGGRICFDDEIAKEIADPATRHLVDSSRYYFRTTPTFETGHPSYLWLNTIVSIGIGRLIEGGVAYEVFELR